MESVAIHRNAPGTASVALFDLDLSGADLEGCFALLDQAERERAERFRYPRDRSRFVARRGQLRAHLACELGVAPYDLRIVVDEHGKPALPDDPDLAFNLSHSNGLALCATIRGSAIGCDIEWRNPELACPNVAQRLFAPDEYAALTALPPGEWVTGFFNCWTRKEAYVKALGLGLSYPLDAFAVSLAPGEPACFDRVEPGWTLVSFEPAPGFQAALVTSTGPWPKR
jgi:4'-phosphopantetheinyl transferase